MSARGLLLQARPASIWTPPSGLWVPGLDASNHNGDLWDEFLAHPEARVCVIRAPLSVEPPELAEIALRQVEQARRADKIIQFYVWCYRSVDPRATLDELVGFGQRGGIRSKTWWLDLETYKQPGQPGYDPGPDADWLINAYLHSKRLAIAIGHYTALWWIRDIFPGGLVRYASYFAAWLHWIAEYDGSTDPGVIAPDWQRWGFNVAAQQYAGSPIDLDIFRADVL